MTSHSVKRVGLALATCLALCFLVGVLWPSRQPAYNGHSLSYWFHRLPVLSGRPDVGFGGIFTPPQGATLAEGRTALKAMKAMGTNALPYLISKLQAPGPSQPVRLLYHYAGRWPLVGKVMARRDPLKDHGRALAGLLALCPLPPDAERKLRDVSLDFRAPASGLATVVVKAQSDPRVVQDNLRAY